MTKASERAVVPSPIGNILLETDGASLTAVRLAVEEPAAAPRGELLRTAAREVEEYFAGGRREFSVPLRLPEGSTDFQRRAWEALARIPFGSTRTYGELARELATSPRAVGGACARNALPLVIPCHRVVAKQGLGGFAGHWETGMALDVKKVLLELEAKGSTGPASS
ncbi:MAG: methylated-DNA--[protein]-cysteine S-methyltransferase [Deltaproteobacteria bacterium]|nr:methylated-DNA--[protein]-cysteine S-methyltransferase [Deltaproteobacteria bacterium]